MQSKVIPKVMAIDPALRKTGIVIMERKEDSVWIPVETHIIKTQKDKSKKMYFSVDLSRRVNEIILTMLEIAERHNICHIVAEAPSGSQSASGAYAAAIAISTPTALSILTKCPLDWVTEIDVKLSVVGKKNANKNEIKNKILSLYPFLEEQYKSEKKDGVIDDFEHIADAIGVFMAAQNNNRLIWIERIFKL